MNYTDFIQLHPWADLIIELFKDIMPTVVALLAIYFNNKMAAKREKNKNKIDIKVKALINLQNAAIDVNNKLFDAGREFLNYMHFLDSEQIKEENWSKYYQKLSEMLMASRRLLIISEMEYEKIRVKDISFEKGFNLTSNFHIDIKKIMDEYNEKAIITPREDIDLLLDEVQFKLIIASDKIENEIKRYIKSLSTKMVEISEN
ncbi:hypothetical protein [Clostridium perfringens]|uniref:hypothetical protein n=1 Tax=Clostridium perfringens TaxID=1502 RepID=UPI002FE1CE2F